LITFNVQVVIIKGPLIVGEIVHIISGKGRRGKPKLLKCQYAYMRMDTKLADEDYTSRLL